MKHRFTGLICAATFISCSSGREKVWTAPDTTAIPRTEEGSLIRYGRDLLSNTAFYLGPEGTVAHISNGMSCQNCHLAAGTVPWGNNYSAAASTYPKFRERSGTVESLEKKINDCLERSLNGSPLDTASREMHAMIAYMRWLGKKVAINVKPKGSGILRLPLLDRAADTVRGAMVYMQRCKQCHGSNGEGQWMAQRHAFLYPPLWGTGSYNTGAGIYRLSKLAGYVKGNMPQGTTYLKAVLTDEEAWDVAAYINSRERPVRDFNKDWPDVRTKPPDDPFGPYADTFSENRHKYGPWQIMQLKN